MYVAVVTGGHVKTLSRAVLLLARELEATAASDTLHIWVTLGGALSQQVVADCHGAAAACGIRVEWRHVARFLERSDPMIDEVRRAIACALPATTYVGATRLLMKREAAGQGFVSIDDDVVGVVARAGDVREQRRFTTSREVLLHSAADGAALEPAKPGALLELLNPGALLETYSAGAHVVQAGLTGDAGADAPVTELEYGLRVENGKRARTVCRIPSKICVAPLDRLMTYAWSASADASGSFFPVAFRNAESVWASLERLRRPAIRLAHVPVGCVHQPARRRDWRTYSLARAVLQWRTNDWLSLLWVDITAERGDHRIAADILASVDGARWHDLVLRSRRLRRAVLRHRVAQLETHVRAGRTPTLTLTSLMPTVADEYRREDCWVPAEWRPRAGIPQLADYVRATGRLAGACSKEVGP